LAPDGKQLFAVPASSLAFTPDGGRILTTLDRTAQLRDARTGNSVATFRSPEPLYAAMMRSGSPQTVVTVGTTKARVWDVAQPGRPVSTFGTTKRLAYAALSPDGVSVLTVSPNDSRLWNVSSHKSIRVGGAGPEPGAGAEFDSALADFASDGRFAIAGRSEVPVFDRGGERLVMLRGHTTPTSVVRFSPDGQFVATGATGGGVRIWDAATGGSRAVLDAHQDAVSALAFSPNGRLLVTAASDGTVVVWLLDFVRDQRLVTQTAQRSPNFVAMLPSHEDRVTDAAFSPDGTRIVTASDDGTVTVSPATPSGAMRVAEAERVINVGSSAALATFSANGLLVGVETSDGWAGVWDATRKRAHVDATSDFISLAFTPDGRSVLTALDDGSAHLWDVRSEKSVAAFRAPEEEPLATASLSRDGRLLVTTGVSIARVWDTERRVQLGAPFRVDGDTVYAVFSPDGRSLLTVCAGDARLWSLGNRRQVALEGGGPVDEFGESGYSLAGVADFARDGRIALAGRRTVALFDERGAPLATLRGHTAETTIVRFSRDARLVATAGLDRTARIWDANTGQSLAILKGHRNDLNALAFSPDGKLLVTAASDGTAIVWRVPTR
jgi:WD40 repeat protein